MRVDHEDSEVSSVRSDDEESEHDDAGEEHSPEVLDRVWNIDESGFQSKLHDDDAGSTKSEYQDLWRTRVGPFEETHGGRQATRMKLEDLYREAGVLIEGMSISQSKNTTPVGSKSGDDISSTIQEKNEASSMGKEGISARQAVHEKASMHATPDDQTRNKDYEFSDEEGDVDVAATSTSLPAS